jgi:hypothetical protein
MSNGGHPDFPAKKECRVKADADRLTVRIGLYGF